MFAGNPLRVKQRHRTGLDRHGHVDVIQPPGGVRSIHLQTDGRILCGYKRRKRTTTSNVRISNYPIRGKSRTRIASLPELCGSSPAITQ